MNKNQHEHNDYYFNRDDDWVDIALEYYLSAAQVRKLFEGKREKYRRNHLKKKE